MKTYMCPNCGQETLTYSIDGDTTLVERYICSECDYSPNEDEGGKY